MIEAVSDIGWGHLIFIWLTVTVAAALRSFTGFGFALAAMPAFSLFLAPTDAVVLSASFTLALSLMNLRKIRQDVAFRPLCPLILATAFGTAIGTAILSEISVRLFQLGAGVAVIFACLGLAFLQPSERWRKPVLVWITGMVSGVMNGALALPGPPMIIYAMLAEPDPRRSKAFLMAVFMISAIVALMLFAAAGFIKRESLWLFLAGLPPLLAGHWIGHALFQRYGDAIYRKIAFGGLLAIGTSTILRALF